jgi:hypothetical protein
VKDLHTRIVILRCNSSGLLYPICHSPPAEALTTTATCTLRHCRLGHPGHHTMTHLHRSKTISYNKEGSHLCHACQLVKHVRLPLFRSQTSSSRPFVLLHCDLWTSPIPSSSGFLYLSHYCGWIFSFFPEFPPTPQIWYISHFYCLSCICPDPIRPPHHVVSMWERSRIWQHQSRRLLFPTRYPSPIFLPLHFFPKQRCRACNLHHQPCHLNPHLPSLSGTLPLGWSPSHRHPPHQH